MLESLFESTTLHASDIQQMDSQKLGLMDVVRLELCITGLIPTQGIASNRWRLKLFRWYQNLLMCFYVPVMAGQMLAMYHFWGDVDTVTDCAGTFFLFVACFFDYLYLIEHEKSVLHVCELLEGHPIPKVNTPHLVEKYLDIVEGCRREIRIVMRCFWGLAVLGGIKWLIYNPVNDLIVDRHFSNKSLENNEKPNADFVFIIWFPFDATWSPLFEVIYMFQSVLLLMAACHNICANSTFITFMVHAWGKLEIAESTMECMEEELHPELFQRRKSSEDNDEMFESTPAEVLPQDETAAEGLDERSGFSGVDSVLIGNSSMYQTEEKFSNIVSDDLIEAADDSMPVSNPGVASGNPEDDEPFLYLVKCVKQHQHAIEFVDAVDELISSWLAVRLFAFQMVAIGEVFQFVVSLDDWQQSIRHLVLLFLSLSQILMYCAFGEQVLQGGWDVDHAMYSTPWYTYSQRYKRHLALVIMRAQRPVEITVGHYYSLSLQSCELIIQNIYFFSMFLNQINNKSNSAALE